MDDCRDIGILRHGICGNGNNAHCRLLFDLILDDSCEHCIVTNPLSHLYQRIGIVPCILGILLCDKMGIALVHNQSLFLLDRVFECILCRTRQVGFCRACSIPKDPLDLATRNRQGISRQIHFVIATIAVHVSSRWQLIVCMLANALQVLGQYTRKFGLQENAVGSPRFDDEHFSLQSIVESMHQAPRADLCFMVQRHIFGTLYCWCRTDKLTHGSCHALSLIHI